jgi:hypothetical protein
MSADPAALQLRLLQTVVEVAAEKNSTLVMPVPVELLRFFDRAARAPASEAQDKPAGEAQDKPAGEAQDNHRLPGAPAMPALTAPAAPVAADPELVAP